MAGRSQRHKRELQGIDSNNKTTGTTRDPHIATNPSVSGTATNGSTLTGTNGTFTGVPTITITRQWIRQNASTGAQSTIAGETGATYVLAPADVGFKIRFQNTATNRYGSKVSQSAVTATVA